MSVEQDVEEFLSHHGVKGQKWGIRNLVKQHELNKASKARDKAKAELNFNKLRKKLRPSSKTKFTTVQRKADIDRARKRVNSGALAVDRKEAKVQYKKDKQRLGRREARKILKRKRNVLNSDFERSQQIRDGKEMVQHIINTEVERRVEEERTYRERENQRSLDRQRSRDAWQADINRRREATLNRPTINVRPF